MGGKAPAGDRIIGGTNAGGVVPWQVSLREVQSGLDENMKPFEMSTHYCGGTILDEKTILSAAHCFPKGAEGVEGKQIMAGSVNVQDTKTSQRIDMEKIIKNTKLPWTAEDMKNDIIIIKLKSPLKFNDNVQPACLPDVASFVKAQASKQMAVLSGYEQMDGVNDVTLSYTFFEAADSEGIDASVAAGATLGIRAPPPARMPARSNY